MNRLNDTPWVVVGPKGIYWIGHVRDEYCAWNVAFGWPGIAEIADAKSRGWYAAQATVTWKKPMNTEDAVAHNAVLSGCPPEDQQESGSPTGQSA